VQSTRGKEAVISLLHGGPYMGLPPHANATLTSGGSCSIMMEEVGAAVDDVAYGVHNGEGLGMRDFAHAQAER